MMTASTGQRRVAALGVAAAAALAIGFGPAVAIAEEQPQAHGDVADIARPQTSPDTLHAVYADKDFTQLFDKTVARIRMRDGAELHTEIYTPKGQAGRLPIILERTPYGLDHDKYGYSGKLRQYPEFIREGYVLVFQDTRGRGASTGKYISISPLRNRSDPKATDESTDAYDSIDWLVKNVPNNNGRVGILGISYGAFLTTRALVDPHPALRAASPQATCTDMFVGDDWHHNGAFRLDYSFSWIASMEEGIGRSDLLSQYDHYDRFLKLGPLSQVNEKILHGRAPSWNAFAEHPNYDDYWKYEMCGVTPHAQPVKVPTLDVAGWFDAEDFYGALDLYKTYEAKDPKAINNLVVGPWYHGGWTLAAKGRKMQAIDFGSDTSEYFRDHIQGPWFAYWLKDKGSQPLPEVLAFRTGENRWEKYSSWPPKEGVEEQRLYLHEAGKLAFAPPSETDARDDYVSDPAKPVPYMPRPITYEGWPQWEMADQRFVDGRPDVLTYVTDPLQEDLTITGEPIAHLSAATTGSDSDWIVKLIDVYPEPYEADVTMSGYEFMVAGEVFRGRYRESFARPSPITPGAVTNYEISLRARNHTFKKGHRIMVQIQSSWFPLIDRNPQTFVPNIYQAVAKDFTKATQSIYRSAQNPTFISLPVNKRTSFIDQ